MCGSAHQQFSSESRQREIPSLQHSPRPPRSRRKYGTSLRLNGFSTFVLLVFTTATLLPLSNAAFIQFENCINRTILNSNLLKFTPLYFWAKFNTSAESHNLNITIYGDVSGQATEGPYPPSTDQHWKNPNETLGKIVDVSPTNPFFTTLFSNYKVLTYTAFNSGGSQFCLSTVNTTCPIAPVFNDTRIGPYSLPAFTVGHDFYSSYSFATLQSTIRINSGDAGAPELSCVSANITPDLGSKLSDTLCYLPAAVLALVAIATVFAAIWSPWGTSNVFRWTSNYGRDEDLLRLVTPGFGDCLQYIQFIVLAGSLNLHYPGYYQPVVSQASWSILLFNESLVSHGNGSQSLVDGIYVTNRKYGISRLAQLVGMTEEQDIWAGMAVWLLGLIVVTIVLGQLGFFFRWIVRLLNNSRGSDLRSLNWPFTAGNVVRIVFNYFLLPIISLSLFQMVVARSSPASVVAMAVVLLLGVIAFAVWIFWSIFTTRPRAHLFDDLPTVLTYGPLYNTYSDDAAPFAFIPVLLTTIRGIAIGGIQPSGVAQLIMLAICEVILILTLHAFRPFQSNTSMNAYHTFFSVIRLVTTLLMVAFVPSLGVSEAPKGWIGYAILLAHAVVLVFGFFLNSLQTLIEVVARLAGAGGDERGGLTKVFGKRQLSKRTHRRGQRSSLNSTAAMLGHEGDAKSLQRMGGRSRSLSGSSAVLLNQPYSGSQRASLGFDQFSQGENYSNYSGTTPGTPGTNATPWSYLGGGSGQNSRRPTMGTTMENSDLFYRPPRPRKQTVDTNAPGVGTRVSGGSADLTNTPYADSVDQAEAGDAGEGPSSWSPNRGSITPAYLRMHRDDSDPNLAERRKNTDYSVRESDFYYGLRGPALSAQPTRKLKTGPADPMGPVSSATGWFKTFFSGKKEKGKGFEVVRSTRMPPQMMPLEEDDESPPISQEPYRDSPGSPSDSKKSPERGSPVMGLGAAGVRRSNDSDSDQCSDADVFDHRMNRISNVAPTLGPIETGGGIELPSRMGSRVSKASRAQPPSQPASRAPTLPRKSSRRPKSTDRAVIESSSRLSTVVGSPPSTPGRMSAHLPIDSGHHLRPNSNALPVRLPFGSSEPSPSPERSAGNSAASSIYPNDAASDLNHFGPTDDLVPPQIIQTGTERPPSTGFVHQHMARDSIRNDGYDTGTHLETSAEFVDGRSRSVSTQHSAGSHRGR
ncbi:integral membrane protein [Zopfia rhizophila CBS 207.26]|uniref:Integral membrane protein n=1 Tax=Zopfia rhizophila CBS 207.26 TaxID=1314779 RepID=A0A6A6E609_9PEZI|nr:integral membrane protein [Zopfia rhizophila CBS 207.26]